MATKNKKTALKKSEPYSMNNILITLGSILVIAFLFYAVDHTALFNGYSAQYDKPIFSSLLIMSLLLILLGIDFFFNWELADTKSLLSIYIWLLPLSFWISGISAASSNMAHSMTNIHIGYVTLFLAGAYLCRNEFRAKLLQTAITIVGSFVVLYGLACAFGNIYSRDAVMLTVDGYRLTSVFQYANAYAAFLVAILLCCLYYITHSRKWYIIFANSMMLVPILVSFWLTLSRGGIVTLPFIFLACILLLPLIKQLTVTLYTLLSMAASFLLTDSVTDKSTKIVTEVFKTISPDMKTAETYSWFNSESLGGWGTIIAVSLVTASIIFLIQHFVVKLVETKLHKYSSRKLSRWIFPLSLIVIGLLASILLLGTPFKNLLPDVLKTRIENINFQQNSVLERGTFYKDSIKVFKDYPVFGSGGGGWATLYERYQNNPYLSRQAHNFFLQYLVEVGIVGLAILLVLIVTVFAVFIRKSFIRGIEKTESYLIFYFVSISVLIHSVLDFEMSYVLLGGLVFLCLGGLVSIFDEKPAWIEKLKVPSKSRYIYPIIVSIIAIIFLIISSMNVTANRSYERAISYAHQGKSLKEVLSPLDAAIHSSGRPEYYSLKVDFLLQVYTQSKDEQYWNQAKALVKEAREVEPNDRSLLEREYSVYLAKQDLESAVSVVKEGISKYPWELSFYERAASLYNALWNQAKQQNNAQAMEQTWNSLLENYQMIQKGIDHIATLPEGQIQGRAFYHSSIIRYSVGQVYMVKAQYDKALVELQPAATEANALLAQSTQQVQQEQYKTIIRWYLALTQKLGNIDQALLNSFTTTYIQEKQQIETIVSSLK